MNRTALLIIVVALALTGCTSTRTINLGYNAERSLDKVNRLAQRQQAVVTLADGRALGVHQLHVATDSTTWFDRVDGRFHTVATRDLRAVSLWQRGNIAKGALRGTAVGFGIGLGVFSVCLFSAGSEPLLLTIAGPYYIIVVGVGAALGALFGSAAAWKDERVTYRFIAVDPG